MSTSKKLAFLGSGKMATALAQGVLRAGLFTADEMIAGDIHEPSRQKFTETTGITTTAQNKRAVESADAVMLCVKPGDISAVLQPLAELLQQRLLISIAAGVKIASLRAACGGHDSQRIVRVMPNTPALIGRGAAGFALSEAATEADSQLVTQIFSSVGEAFEVKEDLLDAVTGLSGSGPAYVYQIIEALSDGGVLMGLPRPIATRLAAQTLVGAAEMVLQTGKHPGELKDMVSSPGGTTIAGIEALEDGALRSTLISAVRVASEKSKKLGEA
jgi:pyrroline-5-carboxylate reductase